MPLSHGTSFLLNKGFSRIILPDRSFIKMPKIKIELLVAIDGLILAVYYSIGKCYQFSIIDEFNVVYEFEEIFYTVEAAESAGRAAIKTASW
jgi:hypothetical protein